MYTYVSKGKNDKTKGQKKIHLPSNEQSKGFIIITLFPESKLPFLFTLEAISIKFLPSGHSKNKTKQNTHSWRWKVSISAHLQVLT
jgi:hypothetical protein